MRPLGFLCLAGGILALLTGIAADGPDRVSGIIFGTVALAAGAVIMARPAGKKDKAK